MPILAPEMLSDAAKAGASGADFIRRTWQTMNSAAWAMPQTASAAASRPCEWMTGTSVAAGGHQRREQRGGAERAAVHRRPPTVLPISPTAPNAIMVQPTIWPLKPASRSSMSAVGVGGEHAGEDQQRQQHMADHDGLAQDAQLRDELDILALDAGAGECDPQQQGLGEGDGRQHAEGGAPAECIRDQHADGNAEHRRRHDAEGHQRGAGRAPGRPARQRWRWPATRTRAAPARARSATAMTQMLGAAMASALTGRTGSARR